MQWCSAVGLSLNLHIRTHCVALSCVLCSSQNPRVAVDRWKTTPYVIGFRSEMYSRPFPKDEPISSFFSAAGRVFFQTADHRSQNRQASFKWMRKSAFSLDHLIGCECSLTVNRITFCLLSVGFNVASGVFPQKFTCTQNRGEKWS